MPAFFVPARNSRHRTACFALYKALLRQGTKVPLPGDLVRDFGPVHPIKHLVRRSFQRNQKDTSSRLVVAALQNGYRFLEVLAKAASPDTPEHASILAFLHARLPEILASRAYFSNPDNFPAKPSTAPRPGHTPLLTREFDGTSISYRPTARPLPQAALSGSGRRQVPKFVVTANGIPFLRIRKPQSPVLARVIRQKGFKRQARTTLTMELNGDGMWFADEEDQWETVIDSMDEDKRRPRQEHAEEERIEAQTSYREAVEEGVDFLSKTLSSEKSDGIARAKALLQIVEQEAELAAREKEERRAQRRKAWEDRMAQEAKSPA